MEIRLSGSGRRHLTTLQWGHGVEPVEIAVAGITQGVTVISFNGATGLNPWRSVWKHYRELTEDQASMGPRG